MILNSSNFFKNTIREWIPTHLQRIFGFSLFCNPWFLSPIEWQTSYVLINLIIDFDKFWLLTLINLINKILIIDFDKFN
jgi:hypothetical protein